MMPISKDTQQVALTVAGSDPSGGAGVQADIKTFSTIGIYGGAVVTALTIQNTRGVFGILPVDPVFVKDQISHVLNDLDVSHIKVGMLGSTAVAAAVCDVLADFNGEIIYDPILVSSSGRQLLDQEDYDALKPQFLGLCTVLTPNIPELSLLAAQSITSKKSILTAAEKLLKQYGKLRSIICTGGHFKPEKETITDYLLSISASRRSTSLKEYSHPRIPSPNTHGTGCTFSAAFTAYHLLTGNDSEAFDKACGYMQALIKKSASGKIGHGTGPLLHHLVR